MKGKGNCGPKGGNMQPAVIVKMMGLDKPAPKGGNGKKR